MGRERNLQYNFSCSHHEAAFNAFVRQQKALKAIAILTDYLGGLSELSALEIGCSAGYATIWYAKTFREVIAIDIDSPAVLHAKKNNNAPNLFYVAMSGEQVALPNNKFDVIFCMHVYEHVPNATRLMEEIWRLLKPGGTCLFTAGNRLAWMEPHYRLPLLSVIPKFLAHQYLQLLGRGRYYYERHLTYWGLRRLTRNFELVDYTYRVLEKPVEFHATEVVDPGSAMQKIALTMLRWLPWLSPTYLWVLRKV
jgi:2-polyprenyl-3-methyl-5-hydroxy-6-metoxy-1,4-benzoquinol methylase